LTYIVAVRALCEFTAKQGDLDLRFTPSPSAQEGIAGHAVVAGRRGAHYQSELPLAGDYKQLHVRGRADGYDPQKNQLEEVKTYRGDLSRMPDNHRHLHWAQVKIYGWLLCQKESLTEVHLALVYYDIGSQEETLLTASCTADELQRFFEEQCERFLAWAAQELQHRAARDEALSGLRFPHADFRPGQRQLSEAIYNAARAGRCLLAQAPTGIGKTVGTLFPLLKAAPGQKLDKVFFLAAKTSGRGLAFDALRRIAGNPGGMPLRVLELVAREKSCEHPDKACHGDSCPLAKGFYDRLPAARQAALQGGLLDQPTLRAVALDHRVCPYYLAQDLARWSDVVVGDYNYYFDLSAMLYGLTLANEWRVSVLVDEAHNMIERTRKMYSAELDQTRLRVVRADAPKVVKKSLDALNRQWQALNDAQEETYQVHDIMPDRFRKALQQAITAITDFLAENPTYVDTGLQQLYFDLLHFSRVADLFDRYSLFDLTKSSDAFAARTGKGGSVLCLRNIIPAPFLKERFDASRSTALFSATLSPWHFYADTLGLPDTTAIIEVESPFQAEQLAVQVVSDISTRYQHRDRSLLPIVDLMARQFAQRPGNYLSFFSSFDYLEKVAAAFKERYPAIPAWEQARRMDEREREQFLARFEQSGQGIGFAVLGGVFGEGIDLPGERLIGAFIATLGLPQINPVNEQIRLRMDALFGAGYDYTYFYPGLQKVVQAAGRVIRTQSDQGVIYLIDDRFARPEALRLLPAWWRVDRCSARGSSPASAANWPS
jgi:DNA excision repair protein ERCC-2